MQFFARLEAHGLSGGDADFSSGTRVAAYSGFAGADAEDAEAAKFDALTGGEGLFEALEYGVNCGFRLGAGQSRALDHVMDNVLLNQWGNLARASQWVEKRPMDVIVQVLSRM